MATAESKAHGDKPHLWGWPREVHTDQEPGTGKPPTVEDLAALAAARERLARRFGLSLAVAEVVLVDPAPNANTEG